MEINVTVISSLFQPLMWSDDHIRSKVSLSYQSSKYKFYSAKSEQTSHHSQGTTIIYPSEEQRPPRRLPEDRQSVLHVLQQSDWGRGSGSRALTPVRQVQVPSEEQRPPRRLPAATQFVEHVDQQSDWGAGMAAVPAAKAMKALMNNENCILILDQGERRVLKMKLWYIVAVLLWCLIGIGMFPGVYIILFRNTSFSGFEYDVQRSVRGS